MPRYEIVYQDHNGEGSVETGREIIEADHLDFRYIDEDWNWVHSDQHAADVQAAREAHGIPDGAWGAAQFNTPGVVPSPADLPPGALPNRAPIDIAHDAQCNHLWEHPREQVRFVHELDDDGERVTG